MGPDMGLRPKVARIRQPSMRDGAYGALRDAFDTGQFAPGDTLTLQGLADQLGISLTPVREAVRRLVAEGALIDTPSRTLVVPQFSLRRMRDLKSARIALETIALDRAIDRAAPNWIAGLEATLCASDDDHGPGPNLRQNHAFHFALYRQSDSEVLLPLVEALWLQYGTYLNLIMHHPETPRIADHRFHHAIIAALRRGDRAAAKAALIDDIERSFRVLVPADEPKEPT
jgi:DNA-binding GntR family transcriptional regulator